MPCTLLDEMITRQVDLISMLTAHCNGLEDARDGHPPQSRYLGLTRGHEQAYRDGYQRGLKLKEKGWTTCKSEPALSDQEPTMRVPRREARITRPESLA